MSEHTEQMRHESRHNGDKSPQEIEAEINHTRAELSETLDAISHKLSPGELVDQALGYLRGPNEFVGNLSDSVKRNPIPVALVGIGLSWLMISGREGSMPSTGSESESAGHGLGLGERVSGVKERVKSGTQQMRAQVGEMSERLHERSARAQESVRDLWNEQPLVVGMLGLALGALVGAVLPSSRKEDELMGRQHDDLVRTAAEVSEEQLHEAQAAEAAHRPTEQTPGSFQGPTPGMH